LHLRAACSCGQKCLYHMKVFKLHLRNDYSRIMKGSAHGGSSKGCTRQKRCCHDRTALEIVSQEDEGIRQIPRREARMLSRRLSVRCETRGVY
jgi:hypothetical protein